MPNLRLFSAEVAWYKIFNMLWDVLVTLVNH